MATTPIRAPPRATVASSSSRCATGTPFTVLPTTDGVHVDERGDAKPAGREAPRPGERTAEIAGARDDDRATPGSMASARSTSVEQVVDLVAGPRRPVGAEVREVPAKRRRVHPDRLGELGRGDGRRRVRSEHRLEGAVVEREPATLGTGTARAAVPRRAEVAREARTGPVCGRHGVAYRLSPPR